MKLSCVSLAISAVITLSSQSAALPPCEPVEPTLMLLDGGVITPVTVEEYVAGVVAHELPYTFEPEAMKAQAVAARTYLYYCLAHDSHPHESADVCTDITHCMGYITEAGLAERYGADSAARSMEAAIAAAHATEGEVILYNGEPILAVWHSSSGGKTEDCAAVWEQSLPYLVSVDTPETAETFSLSFSLDEISRRLSTAGYKYNRSLIVSSTATDSGRCASLTIGSVTLDGGEARSVFGLRSTDFKAFSFGGRLYFFVSGYGHGAGMSQYGANAMAESGAGYREILAHYYTGAAVYP